MLTRLVQENACHSETEMTNIPQVCFPSACAKPDEEDQMLEEQCLRGVESEEHENDRPSIPQYIGSPPPHVHSRRCACL